MEQQDPDGAEELIDIDEDFRERVDVDGFRTQAVRAIIQARITLDSFLSTSTPLPPIDPDLVAAIRSGDCVLFAGSGVSAQVGLPTWYEILYQLVKHFDETDSFHKWGSVRRMLENDDRDVVTDLISARVARPDLTSALEEILLGTARVPRPGFLENLGRIPFARVLTANWDGVVEATFVHRLPVILSPAESGKFAAAFRSAEFQILKLYGDLTGPEGFTFSAEEFRRSIDENPEFFKFVSSIFSSNTLLFVGVSSYGITDFVSALRIRHTPHRKHYALLPRQPKSDIEAERLLSRYGIQVLTFDPTSGFPEVADWIATLAADVADQPTAVGQCNGSQDLRITRIQLQNIGSFSDFDQTLGRGWTLLLGNNGVGKSTLLRAVALAVCGADDKARSAARHLLRVGQRAGCIRIWIGTDCYESRLVRDGNDVRVECDRFTPLQSGSLLALGFPALRGASTRSPDGPVAGFESNPVVEDVLPLLTGLVDARIDNLKQWMVNVQARVDSSDSTSESISRNTQMRDTFFRIMDQLSPGLEIRFQGVDPYTWQVMVSTQDGVVPIDQLSQGMSGLLCWVGTLLERMYEIYQTTAKPEGQPALVLVDEIAAHLHPEWEYALVPLIRKNFPNVQVIATTHSPLVVLNSRKGELLHLRREGTAVNVERIEMSFAGLRADQILTSPAFGLPTTLHPDTRRLRDEYQELLGQQRTADQEHRFGDIARQLSLRIPNSQETATGREAVDLLEEWMIERIKDKPEAQRREILKEAALYFSQLDPGNPATPADGDSDTTKPTQTP